MDRPIFASCGTRAMNYFASLGILCVRDAGRRGNKITVPSVLATRTTSWLYPLGTERKEKITVKNDIKNVM